MQSQYDHSANLLNASQGSNHTIVDENVLDYVRSHEETQSNEEAYEGDKGDVRLAYTSDIGGVIVEVQLADCQLLAPSK